MINKTIAIFAMLTMICFEVYAEDKKPKDLDLVTDAVAAVFKKTGALLAGELEVTMSQDDEKYRSKNEYTHNVLGQKVPRATASQSGSSLHSE